MRSKTSVTMNEQPAVKHAVTTNGQGESRLLCNTPATAQQKGLPLFISRKMEDVTVAIVFYFIFPCESPPLSRENA